jgi:hypothetical protein
MTESLYTPEEFSKFRSLYIRTGSRAPQTRLEARLDMMEFEKEHGAEKLTAMLQALPDHER